MDKDTSVKVAVRLRPLSEDEANHDSEMCLNIMSDSKQILAGHDNYFTFDYVFGPETSQATIFDQCVQELVDAAFEGFNATILAYGQTGSGKTFTMGSAADTSTPPQCSGIIPRVINTLFAMVRKKELDDPTSSYKIFVQFLEIYGEDIKDLLDTTKTSRVQIREAPSGDVYVSGAREELVNSEMQMMRTLEDGSKHRVTAATKMNQTSSRSHAIFTVILEHTIRTGDLLNGGEAKPEADGEPESEDGDDAGEQDEGWKENQENAATASDTQRRGSSKSKRAQVEVRKCKFHFVDLAGSERAKRTGAQGHQMKEGIDINKGLLALGNVISALGDESKRGKVFVPYRDSKLTRILQDSLGGNSKTLMICCASPASLNYSESVNALRYANRARNIQNKPIVNRDPTLVLIDELKHLLSTISAELFEIRVKKEFIEVENAVSLRTLEALATNVSASAVELATKSIGGASSGFSSNNNSNGGGGGGGNSSSYSGGSNPYSSKGYASSTSSSRGHDELSTSAASAAARSRGPQSSSSTVSNAANSGNSGRRTDSVKSLQQALDLANREVIALKNRLIDSDFEIQRLTDQLKNVRKATSESADQVMLARSERDFFRMKWAELAPEEAHALDVAEKKAAAAAVQAATTATATAAVSADSAPSRTNNGVFEEKKRVVGIVGNHLREIEELRQQLVQSRTSSENEQLVKALAVDDSAAIFDEDTSSSVALLISQTRAQLKQEAKRMRDLEKKEKSASKARGELEDDSSEGEDQDHDQDHDDTEKDGGSDEENGASSGEEAVGAIEEEEHAFRRRQKALSEEVVDIGQSIQLKEQLVAQLTKSQHQFQVMKVYYEQKLEALGAEVLQKERERESMLKELQSIEESKHEELAQKQEREKKLREDLLRKDEELNTLKHKREELRNSVTAQQRYTSQLTRLQGDIAEMKKQKVDLTKTMQSEKKNYMNALKSKAQEIEKLKRELSKSANEIRKLGRGKEIAEGKVRNAMREGALLKKKAQDAQKLNASESVAANTRAAIRAMSKASRLSINGMKRILSEEELKTKKWIDKRINEISSREAAAENLKKQYETQLELLNRKATLEEQRRLALLRDNASVAADKAQADREAAQGAADGSNFMLSKKEGMRLLEIEDHLATVVNQIDSKSEQISKLQEQVDKHARDGGSSSSDSVASSERTLEVLKRSAAGSLPASHELIRLLFDMLVNSSKTVQAVAMEVREGQIKLKRVQVEKEQVLTELAAVKRRQDIETTKLSNEYEEKLADIFTKFSFGLFDEMENEQGSSGGKVPTADPTEERKGSHDELPGISSAVNVASSIQIATAKEQCSLLKRRLEREQATIERLRELNEQEERAKQKLQRELDEKEIQIKFLEDDRCLFKEMADEMRKGLVSMGKTGKNVVDSAKDRATQRSKSTTGLFTEYSEMLAEIDNLDLGEEEDDDTESLMGEFDFIEQEIQRTGGVNASNSASTSARNVVYDRLTNPQNFTGAMKKVFDADLETKRKRIQMVRNQKAEQWGGGSGPSRGATRTNSLNRTLTVEVPTSVRSNGPSSTSPQGTLSKEPSISSDNGLHSGRPGSGSVLPPYPPLPGLVAGVVTGYHTRPLSCDAGADSDSGPSAENNNNNSSSTGARSNNHVRTGSMDSPRKQGPSVDSGNSLLGGTELGPVDAIASWKARTAFVASAQSSAAAVVDSGDKDGDVTATIDSCEPSPTHLGAVTTRAEKEEFEKSTIRSIFRTKSAMRMNR